MKHMFTGLWVFAIASFVFYFAYAYIGLPFTKWVDTAGGDPPIDDPAGLYMLAFIMTFIMAALFALLLLIIYKVGETINNR